MATSFSTAGRIVTGWGCLGELGALARGIGRRALLVTGRAAMRQAGITDRAVAGLEEAGCAVFVYEDVPPEPTLACVDAGRDALRRHEADLVIGLGGGSAIDVAKAIGALARAVPETRAFFAGEPAPERGVPIVTIPTTAGTGAEVTRNSVLADPDAPAKQSIRGDALMPAVALVDPELTVSMPPSVTARSGMDALTQAIESYWSIHATPLTEPLALGAIELIGGHLERAATDGGDRAAREAMAYGSLTAGVAFANSRLGAVHGLAHPLGVRYAISHGEVCAILLPHVMRLNRQAAPEKYDRIGVALGGDAADAAAGLLSRLDLPVTLKHVGLRPTEFDVIIAESMPSGSLKANPKTVSEDDLRAILTALV